MAFSSAVEIFTGIVGKEIPFYFKVILGVITDYYSAFDNSGQWVFELQTKVTEIHGFYSHAIWAFGAIFE